MQLERIAVEANRRTDLLNNYFGEFEIKDEREPNSVEQERTETTEPVGCLFSVGSLDRRTNVVPQLLCLSSQNAQSGRRSVVRVDVSARPLETERTESTERPPLCSLCCLLFKNRKLGKLFLNKSHGWP